LNPWNDNFLVLHWPVNLGPFVFQIWITPTTSSSMNGLTDQESLFYRPSKLITQSQWSYTIVDIILIIIINDHNTCKYHIGRWKNKYIAHVKLSTNWIKAKMSFFMLALVCLPIKFIYTTSVCKNKCSSFQHPLS
jgi:hypothetical protein